MQSATTASSWVSWSGGTRASSRRQRAAPWGVNARRRLSRRPRCRASPEIRARRRCSMRRRFHAEGAASAPRACTFPATARLTSVARARTRRRNRREREQEPRCARRSGRSRAETPRRRAGCATPARRASPSKRRRGSRRAELRSPGPARGTRSYLRIACRCRTCASARRRWSGRGAARASISRRRVRTRAAHSEWGKTKIHVRV